jgi:hypothetical protein
MVLLWLAPPTKILGGMSTNSRCRVGLHFPPFLVVLLPLGVRRSSAS